MSEVQLDNYPKYCNAWIQENYQDKRFMLMPSDFVGAFAYWVASQQMGIKFRGHTIMIEEQVEAFQDKIDSVFVNIEIPQWFTYEQLNDIISEDMFKKIPDVMALNELQHDFVDLGALARNVMFMIMRESILNNIER